MTAMMNWLKENVQQLAMPVMKVSVCA